ncbi:MAG: glycosyltransferase family 39 protein [Polyangiales bacterium]
MSSTALDARRERLLWALPVIVSLLFCLPALWADHYNDDWTMRFIAEGRATTYDASPLRLFEFTRSPEHTTRLIEGGFMPWWSSPSLRLRFFRPLSSLLFAAEARLFGEGPRFAHIHSVVWFALVLWLVSQLFRTVLTRRTALIATWIAALSPHAVNGALWPSARNGMCGAAAALAALLLHARARTQDHPVPRAWIALLFLLGLGFGEITLGLVPLALALEWALNERGSWKQRLSATAPVLVIGHAYLAAYVLLGYGAGGSAMYLDPFKELGVALREIPLRLGILVLDGLYAVPSELYLLAPSARLALAIVSLSSLLALLVALHRTRADRAASDHRAVMALLIGSLFAAAPGLFGIPGGRLLSIAIVGFAAALAAMIDRALSRRAEHRASSWALLVAALVVRVVFASVVRLGFSLMIVSTSLAQRRIASESRFQCPARSTYALIEGADPTLGMYAAPALSYVNRSIGGSFRVLSMHTDALIVERTGDRAITLTPASGGTLTGFVFADVFRSPRERFEPGQVLRLGAMTVRVLAVRDGRPQRAEFVFDAAFEGGATCLLRWHNGRLESFAPPALGQSVRIEHERGPSGV